jgi:RNA polymerase sigma-70 factor (ECF subfamily)
LEGQAEAQAKSLMTRAKRGDRRAFDELALLLRPRAYRQALAMVGSHEDALELSQDSFLKLYQARSTWREDAAFLPWFQRILRNACFSFLRRRGRRSGERATGADPESDDAPDALGALSARVSAPDSGLLREETARVFWRAFETLAARDREILALRHFQELSYREIAAALEIPVGTVMSRLFHARARLAAALGGETAIERLTLGESLAGGAR